MIGIKKINSVSGFINSVTPCRFKCEREGEGKEVKRCETIGEETVITYFLYDSILTGNLMKGIADLYSNIFGGSAEELLSKVKDKPKLLVNIALDGPSVVGFKMGYELDENKFYSWLGGVDPEYRNHGIASKLMKQQYEYLRKKGYKVVQTKTMNKWRSMLLLNIKNGFDVIETYTDEKGLHKIVLEKRISQLE